MTMEGIKNIPEIYGSMVFRDNVMREKLPKDIYKALKKTIETGIPLTLEVANAVAAAMKDWAIEKGATHYTHWFQPMTGITAEKHDSFIEPADGGSVILEFSGKALIKGESDASSFPSGGLRATFEARGYTAWDPTSYAFVKENTLYIPTAFCSYGGEALDKKTPLLRSMASIGDVALRIVHAFGRTDITSITTTAGPEQEYFLVPEELWRRRPDLIMCGRTLFGARPSKGQELDDHYFGAIKPKIKAFMADLDLELWKLGIAAKTEHNEAAPAQHELAPIFSTTNIACDHNQLTMEMMKKIAQKHSMVCLLHEKPFEGISGSGKHNNWSLTTNFGKNLFKPGDSPEENIQFLIFLIAVITAVDEYADLLRVSVASAGNDCRLGGHEAPPAVVSFFLGDELTAILDSFEQKTPYEKKNKVLMDVGAAVIPTFQKDTTDRNRTSPFAFTGNKFEFRMLGSSASIADTNIVLNTAVSEVLNRIADRLEAADDVKREAIHIIREYYAAHKRVIFNGNGYSADWEEEADRRGLPRYPTAADAIPCLMAEKNVKLFEKHGIFSEAELRSRCDIMLENYCKVIHIEAMTMIDMAKRMIIPSIIKYTETLSGAAIAKQTLALRPMRAELDLIRRLTDLSDEIYSATEELEKAITHADEIAERGQATDFFKKEIRALMAKLREASDKAEALTAKEYWPLPSYDDLIYGVS